MPLARSILAFVIAVSLALLPAGASAAGFAMASGDAQSIMHMGASSDMSMDCCPDDMKGAPSHTDGYKCDMGFCCVGGSIALGDIGTIGFEFLSAAGRKLAIPADQTVAVRAGSPPFRPPRV